MNRVLGCVTSASPAVLPGPVKKLTTSPGTPASYKISMKIAAIVGESLDGFTTTVLPVTTAATVFAPIVFAKINQLGYVRIRFWPGLADFIAQPGIQFVAPLAQNIRRAIQTSHAPFHRHALPALKRRMRLLHSRLRHLHGRLLKHSNHLIGMRRIVRPDLLRGS